MKKKVIIILIAFVVALFSLFLPNVKFFEDIKLNGLITETVTEFLLCVIVTVFALCYYKSNLKFPKINLNALLWLIPECLVVVANFPFHAIHTGQAKIVNYSYVPVLLLDCLLIGVSEEILFRIVINSYIYEKVANSHNGYIKYALISSAVFGLCHLINLFAGAGVFDTLLQVLYSFLIGAMLTAVYEKVNCVWICVIFHALFDFGGNLIAKTGEGVFQDCVFWILTCVFGIICAVNVMVFYFKKNKEVNGINVS